MSLTEAPAGVTFEQWPAVKVLFDIAAAMAAAQEEEAS